VTTGDKPSEPFSLARWSRRKRDARKETTDTRDPEALNRASVVRDGRELDENTRAAAATSASGPAEPAELPPIESLTIESDFAAFLKPDVDPALKQRALRKLFSDPHFNVMDGLDVYIDDYTKTVPLTPDVVAQLEHAKRVLFPPVTRINAQGQVEEVPEATAVTATEQQRVDAATPAPATGDAGDEQNGTTQTATGESRTAEDAESRSSDPAAS
jgi:hypothetical protein